MPNRLAKSSSPYLRQHQNNPVHWFPWCQEAFEKARVEDKAIFLSVGYSACHWCHVMEHESFENQDLANLLNLHFVSIKVDREERPDVDQVYMQAVQMLTGSGGWPMSVFMSPDGKPFFGGTYWPPDSRYGRPGFGQVLLAVADAWKNKRQEITEQGQQIAEHLQTACRGPAAAQSPLTLDWVRAADLWLVSHHDAQHGGFGGAPKFPHAMDLSLLIELSVHDPSESRSAAVQLTLDHMARGGIYDHLGGGFARYSVDERWLVPHFEKMLYDNALLVCAYADAYRLWGSQDDAQIVRESLDYVIRELTNSQGGYYSTEDADSEGVEGKFYVWTPREIEEVLGDQRARQFCDCYDVSKDGNFEGESILNLPKPIRQFARLRGLDESQLRQQLREDRQKLYQRRAQRIRPGLDDKVLLGWNALMISAMVRGYRAVGDQCYLDSARAAMHFLVTKMRRADGHLWHTWREGHASIDAFLDDYAYLIVALLDLFQADCNPQYLTLAIEFSERLLRDFKDSEGGFYFTANEHEQLIARNKDLADSSVPSGNAMAATGLLTLSRLTGRNEFLNAAEDALIAASGVMASSPQAAGQALRALLQFLNVSEELVLFAGQDNCLHLKRAVLKRLNPFSTTLIVSGMPDQQLLALCPWLENRGPVEDQTTLFVCSDSVCQQPLSGPRITEFLEAAALS